MSNDDIYMRVRIHVSLTSGEVISFKKFHKETKIDTIFKEVLDEKQNVIRLCIY